MHTKANIVTWTHENGLQFSETKSIALHFCNLPKCTHQLRIKLNQSLLPTPDTAKYLGLTFDSKLTRQTHILYLKKECYLRINILRKLSHTTYGTEQISLLRIYRSIIQSKCNYGAAIYGVICENSTYCSRDTRCNVYVQAITGWTLNWEATRKNLQVYPNAKMR